MTSPLTVDFAVVQLLMEILATVAFALSGLLEAARKKLDAVGVVVVGLAGAARHCLQRNSQCLQRPPVRRHLR